MRVTHVDHDGLRFQVTDGGPLGGAPVVLLHGFPQTAASWTATAERLHAAGLRTLAPDQRGYSPLARPEGRAAYRLPLLVGDVLALVRTLGRPVHVVGHDWGAAVAWSLAQQHPDLVRSLTTVSVPHPAAFAASMVRSDQLRRSWYFVLFQLPRLPEARLSNPAVLARSLEASGMSAAQIARVRADVVDSGALPFALNWYRALPLTAPRGVRLPARVPTTHVWSEGDVALGRWGAEHTGRYVAAPYRLVVLPGVSHWVPEEAPDALAAAIVERVGGPTTGPATDPAGPG